jgi:hypothetical protein
MKKILSIFNMGLSLFFAAQGDWTNFILSSSFGALMTGIHNKVLFACAYACTLDDLETDDSCNTSGGIQEAYWCQYGDIDWAATVAAVAPDQLFNPTTEVLTGFIMEGAAVWKKISPERKTSQYTFTFGEDTAVYEQEIVINFEGGSAAFRLKIKNSFKCCNLVLLIVDNNCNQRLVGVEWNGTAFIKQVKTLRFGTHVDRSGELGTSKAGNDITLVGESLVAPIYCNVDLTELVLA